MGNETSLCCNTAYVNKNHELFAPEYNTNRVGKIGKPRIINIEDKENEDEVMLSPEKAFGAVEM